MNRTEFLEDVRTDHETALSRLSSSKALYALTEGDMTGDAVRRALAADAAGVVPVFEGWAAETESGDAAAVFSDVAEGARARSEAVGPETASTSASVGRYAPLETLEGTPARAGGLLGWSLVAGAAVEQAVGFFIGDADPSTANEFRSHRSDVEARRDDALDLLEALCESDSEWQTARRGADLVVEGAYDHYVETLESLGIKPKNVC